MADNNDGSSNALELYKIYHENTQSCKLQEHDGRKSFSMVKHYHFMLGCRCCNENIVLAINMWIEGAE